MGSREALRRLHRAADKAVRRAVVWAPLLAAVVGGAIPTRAATSAQLNISVDIRNIGNITDLTAVPGTSSGTIDLAWTEPYRQGGTAPYSYDVRVSSLAQIDNDAAFTAASPLSAVSLSAPPAPGSGGGAAGFVVQGLTEGVTYYFAIREQDSGVKKGVWVRNSIWNLDNFAAAASAVATGPTPSAPTGLSATAGLLAASLSWDALPLPAQGSGLLFYRVLRSLSPSSGFVSVATTTATAYLDKPLAAGVAYYYKVLARDILAVEGPASAAASATPFTVLPMEPLGVKVAPSNSTVSISWSPTTRFFDGAPFVSTGAPSADELAGYAVYRSSDICDPYYVHVASLPVASTALTDDTGGLNYFYRLFSYNSLGVSTNAVTLSSLGERSYFADDCVSRAVLDDATAVAALNGDANGIGDIRIRRTRRPQDVGNGVFQSVEWKAETSGAAALDRYALPKPARIVLHFDVAGGKPVPSATPVGALSLKAVASEPAGAASVNDLGVFWYNGTEFKKMYGRIDAAAQTVTVESPNLGIYQIRAQARAAGAVFDLSNLSGRVITPNGDGLNDTAIFSYDPGPKNIAAEGRIFDLRGAAVAEMVPGLVPNTLTWDGRMSGRPAAGGVYVYRITGDGKTFTGTIVVAR